MSKVCQRLVSIILAGADLTRPGVNPPSTIPNPIPVDFLIPNPNPIPVNLAMILNPIPIPVIFPSAIPNPIPISSYRYEIIVREFRN